MSHQTGITGSDELKSIFTSALNGDYTRTIKVVINEEKLNVEKVVDMKKSFEDDFDSSLEGLIEKDRPCYLFMKQGSAQQWLFITFSPDNAGVREKMLYAATRSSLKSEFGGTYVAMEYFATDPEEVTYKGYLEFLDSKNAPPPLTTAEEDLLAEKKLEKNPGNGASTKKATSKRIWFPLTEEAIAAVETYKSGSVNHIELSINIEKEIIYSSVQNNITANTLKDELTADKAGYHLFNFKHEFENAEVNSHVFVYFVPGYSVPIKERMLYSSCKSSLLSDLEQDFNLKFDRKLECDTAAELTEEFLYSEIHPVEAVAKKKFSKPQAQSRKPRTRPFRNR